MAQHIDRQKIYDYLAAIPHGKVVTYGQIAEFLGNVRLARAVGAVLHRNPDGDRYPCYKVVNAQGRLADSYAFGGKAAQCARLRQEGIPVENDRVDLLIHQYRPHT